MSGIGQTHEIIRATSWRERTAIEVRRQQTRDAGWFLETDCTCRQPCQHRITVKGTSSRPSKAVPGKNVYCIVVGIWPDCILWIVREVSAKIKLIAVVTAGGIRTG